MDDLTNIELLAQQEREAKATKKDNASKSSTFQQNQGLYVKSSSSAGSLDHTQKSDEREGSEYYNSYNDLLKIAGDFEDQCSLQQFDKNINLQSNVEQDITSFKNISKLTDLFENSPTLKKNKTFSNEIDKFEELILNSGNEINEFNLAMDKYKEIKKIKLNEHFVPSKNIASEQDIKNQSTKSLNIIPELQDIDRSIQLHHEVTELNQKLSKTLVQTIERFNIFKAQRLFKMKHGTTEDTNKFIKTCELLDRLQALLKSSVDKAGTYKKSISQLIIKQDITKMVSELNLDGYEIKPPMKILSSEIAKNNFIEGKVDLEKDISDALLRLNKIDGYLKKRINKDIDLQCEQDYIEANYNTVDKLSFVFWKLLGELNSYSHAIEGQPELIGEISVLISRVKKVLIFAEKLKELLRIKNKNLNIIASDPELGGDEEGEEKI